MTPNGGENIETPVRLSVVDLQGREIAVLRDGVLGVGRYEAIWSRGAGVKPGVYFVRYVAGGQRFIHRAVLID